MEAEKKAAAKAAADPEAHKALATELAKRGLLDVGVARHQGGGSNKLRMRSEEFPPPGPLVSILMKSDSAVLPGEKFTWQTPSGKEVRITVDAYDPKDKGDLIFKVPLSVLKPAR